MPPKPKLGVDLDGCVYAWDLGARTHLRLRGNDISIQESTSWNEVSDLVPDSEWQWVWGGGARLIFNSAPVYPGAIRTLRLLQERVDLCIITHRPLSVADITLKRLAEDGIRPYAVVHPHGPKSEVMPDCIAYVEDKPENVVDLLQLHVPIFVPRRAYNEAAHSPIALHAFEARGDDVRIFDHWGEVLQWVREMTF